MSCLSTLIGLRVSAQLANPEDTSLSQVNGVLTDIDVSGVLILVDSDGAKHFYPFWRILNINLE